MQERTIIFAAFLALALHCCIAFVGAPTVPAHNNSSHNRSISISIVSGGKKVPDPPRVQKQEAKKEGVKAPIQKKTIVLKGKRDISEQEKKETAVPAEVLLTAEAVVMQEIAPPPSSNFPSEASKETEKTVTEPAMPCYKSNPPPRYPESARRRGYEGDVLLSVLVDVDGSVTSLKVKKSSGFSALDRAAVEAVEGWEFKPARRMGVAVSMSVDVPVRFVLRHP